MSAIDSLEGKAFQSKDQLYYPPSSDRNDPQAQDFLIFMITGNPGLISFYEPFLFTLHYLLSSSSAPHTPRFHIYGHSLAGFGQTEGESGEVGLKAQIEHMEELLFKQVRHCGTNQNDSPLKVILMGHSVGAYILLELISRHQESVETKGKEDFDLIGGILLFPTITHLAQSPQGMMYSKILKIPYFPEIASAFVASLSYLVSTDLLYGIIKLIMRYPEHAARTAADFIKSSTGVMHALKLAKDEMEEITADKWGKGVWEAATSRGTNARDTANSNLILYWGENASPLLRCDKRASINLLQDKLVANKTRDELIEAREYRSSQGMGTRGQSKEWKPKMLIDPDRIPHAFCLNHSELVAEKVKGWVEEIIEEHGRESLI